MIHKSPNKHVVRIQLANRPRTCKQTCPRAGINLMWFGAKRVSKNKVIYPHPKLYVFSAFIENIYIEDYVPVIWYYTVPSNPFKSFNF